ncbi:MAG TPA: HAD-IA family hydrolase [Patescibacteria group bacterium]|nr:HAD-IA family hydrolase [Patescibacteria group bacterium]
MDERGLGKRLQDARLAAGLTQQQLCQKANLSFSTLTKIERGAIKSPSIFTIQSIAKALQVSLDELVGLKQDSKQVKYRTKTGVSFIYFDLNGCLVHFYQRAFDKISAKFGVHLETIESAFWHYNDQVCRGEMSLSDLNNKLANRIGVDSISWQDFYLETTEPIKEMQSLLLWAKEKYQVGLMTNTMPGLLSALRKNKQIPNLDYDSIVDSSVIGAIKPELKIYQVAEQQAESKPEEILLIDDDRVNLMAAEKLGWHVLWFDDSRPSQSVEKIRDALEPS